MQPFDDASMVTEACSSRRAQPLVVRPVRADEVGRWDALMAAHHYLGLRRLVGESVRYVAEDDGGWLALAGWTTAAFKAGRATAGSGGRPASSGGGCDSSPTTRAS